MRVILLFFFSVNLSFNLKAQTLSIGSKDTLANKNNFYSNQYMSPLYAKNTNFYYGDLIKKKNEYAAVHTDSATRFLLIISLTLQYPQWID
jgi:hypothetical protein